mgnify:CR=1 FL=1
MNMLNIGLGSFVSYERTIAIVSPESAPVKRLVQDARTNGTLIDATFGRRTRAVVIMDNGQVALSSIQPETIIGRNGKSKGKAAQDEASV